MPASFGKAPDFSRLFGGAADKLRFRTGNFGNQNREFWEPEQGIFERLTGNFCCIEVARKFTGSIVGFGRPDVLRPRTGRGQIAGR